MAKLTVSGRGGISARVIADSTTLKGKRITTFELEYPRFFHSEVMTHRMLSKNAASSRAIPIAKMIEHIEQHTARPIYWGKNQPGMKAREELGELEQKSSVGVWDAARDAAISHAKVLDQIGNHKQTVNRILEPFMLMKTVMTGTEWANFLYLRAHSDAQPEFRELANCIGDALSRSSPTLLYPGEWHLPYVNFDPISRGYFLEGKEGKQEWLILDDAQKVSASCCAQVSYRKLDDTLEKAIKVFEMLNVGSKTDPAHASPLEHQATPMNNDSYSNAFGWQEGVTHIDRRGDAWSGNFRSWVQYRKLFPSEARW